MGNVDISSAIAAGLAKKSSGLPGARRGRVDDVVSGLILRVYPSGARTFTLESMMRGRGRYATIGSTEP